jgi:hypothetical protein
MLLKGASDAMTEALAEPPQFAAARRAARVTGNRPLENWSKVAASCASIAGATTPGCTAI